jgi:hypothetical protein
MHMKAAAQMRSHAGRRVRRAGAVVALLALPTILAAGCGGSGTSSTTSAAKVTPADLSRAADVSAATAGYRTVMSVQEKLPGIGQLSMSGSGSFGKHQGSMTVTLSVPGVAGLALGGRLPLSMVIDNGVLYIKLPSALTSRLPGVKPWLELNLRHAAAGSQGSGLSSLVGSSTQLSNPGQYFQWLDATAGSSLKNLGSATIGGIQTTHYHADLGVAQLSHALQSTGQPGAAQAATQLSKVIAGGRIPVDVYVDASNLVRRIVINEALNVAGKNATSTITVDFPQYGPQPPPTVPPANQITNFSALAGGLF